MQPFDASEIDRRISALKAMLRAKGIDAAVLNQGADLYYYSGSVLPLYLAVPAEGEPFLLARKAEARIAREVPFMRLERFADSKGLAAAWAERGLSGARALGFTCDSTSYATVARIARLSPSAAIVDLSMDLRLARMRKSEAEIAALRAGGAVIARLPDVVRARYRPGMTELELSSHIERFFREEGNGVVDSKQEGLVLAPGVTTSGLNSLEGNKFDGVCAGKGASRAVPFGASRDAIRSSAPITFDYAFVCEGYHVDMTRMASVGEPARAVMEAYRAMVEIERALIGRIRPGASWESAWDLAAKMAEELGYGEAFMGADRDKVRFVGHGVGIQLDEPPFLAPKMPAPFEEGMVVAVEPKVALPGIGVVGIEDTIVVGADGNEIITTAPDDFMIL
jgi:Xaa-Pro dipeptidase